MQINILENEYWYGGCVKYGTKMPFSRETAFTVDTTLNPTPNQAMPFLVSSKGRYIWRDTGFRAEFMRGWILVPDDCQVWSEGKNLKDAYLAACAKHFSFDGRIPAIELFDKPIYNTWIELTFYQSQKAVENYAEKILASGLPAGVLMIDDGWSEYYGDWRFHSGKFPEPEKMIKKLHDAGFKVMVWLGPFITADTVAFRYARNHDLLIKNPDGSPYIVDWWNGYSAVYDMSNPEAVAHFRGQLDALMEMGVDGFKFDGGDSTHYDRENVTYANTSANEQAKLWGVFGEEYPFNEFRVTFDEGGAPLLQRLCDKDHSWEVDGLGGIVPDTLAQGITGHPFACPDMIGGGEYLNFQHAMESKLDEELFVRHCQTAALMPSMQFSAAPYRVLGKEAFDKVLAAVKLREKYEDYIVGLVKEAGKTGEPVARYMTYEFPDENCEEIVDQFMLGKELLVAPILTKSAKGRKVYLPKGKWSRQYMTDGKESILESSGEDFEVMEEAEPLIVFKRL
ncbi:MAG: glycoside hydrolase family 31 protein [Pseudobutyrivibrio sp.]|nr:glycoside hydrolase family 31 protein [Pseudobutyrivibrio sp.]